MCCLWKVPDEKMWSGETCGKLTSGDWPLQLWVLLRVSIQNHARASKTHEHCAQIIWNKLDLKTTHNRALFQCISSKTKFWNTLKARRSVKWNLPLEWSSGSVEFVRKFWTTRALLPDTLRASMWRQTHTVARTVQKKWCLGQEGLYNVMPTLCTRIKRILYFQCLWNKRGLGNSWSRILFVKSSMGWSTGSVQCVWSTTIASRIFSGISRAYTFTLIPILAFIVTLLSSLRPKELFKGTLRQCTRASDLSFYISLMTNAITQN